MKDYLIRATDADGREFRYMVTGAACLANAAAAVEGTLAAHGIEQEVVSARMMETDVTVHPLDNQEDFRNGHIDGSAPCLREIAVAAEEERP